jgi:hypothetical protein
MSVRPRPTRFRSASALLAVLFGLVGTFAGTSGAATFIPFHEQNHQDLRTGEVLAVISAVGAVISFIGMFAGYRLMRGRPEARHLALTAAIGSIATVAIFALAMPPATPSPVPGAGAFVLLALVVLAYGLELALLLAGAAPRPSARPDPPASA